jgi:rhodanese-related sulfurtransferase
MAAIDELVRRARQRFKRLTPPEAQAARSRGALLVDTRTADQRGSGGSIPGALVIDRTVLEWRLDPTSPTRVPEAANTEIHVILICQEGYSSSLAAASLLDLGLVNATDVIGGFEAWRAAGLPVNR